MSWQHLNQPQGWIGVISLSLSLSLSLIIGGVLAAPESALCGWIGVIPLSLSVSGICQGMSWQHLCQPVRLDRCNAVSLSLHNISLYETHMIYKTTEY